MIIIGTLGAAVILIGFLLNQRKILHEDDLAYDIINAVGGCLLIVYAIDGRAWPFVVLNGVWTLYSLVDIVTDLRTSARNKTSPPTR